MTYKGSNFQSWWLFGGQPHPFALFPENSFMDTVIQVVHHSTADKKIQSSLPGMIANAIPVAIDCGYFEPILKWQLLDQPLRCDFRSHQVWILNWQRSLSNCFILDGLSDEWRLHEFIRFERQSKMGKKTANETSICTCPMNIVYALTEKAFFHRKIVRFDVNVSDLRAFCCKAIRIQFYIDIIALESYSSRSLPFGCFELKMVRVCAMEANVYQYQSI